MLRHYHIEPRAVRRYTMAELARMAKDLEAGVSDGVIAR